MIKSTGVFAAGLMIAMAVVAASATAFEADPAAKLAVPAADAVTRARALIRDAYEANYLAAKQSGEPAALIDKLRGAADAADDPVNKYAFLLEAEEIAARDDDAVSCLATVDARAQAFEIDGLAERAKTLGRLASSKAVADVTLFEQALATAEKAVEAERFDVAGESATLALTIAKAIDREQKAAARRRMPRGPVAAGPAATLIKSAQDAQARIGRNKKLYGEHQAALTVLAGNPDDATANARAGSYLCLVARNWPKGLPYLAKSDVTSLAALAREELALRKATPPPPTEVFALAGKWWDACESTKSLEHGHDAIKHHAAVLYGEVLDRLTDPLEIRLAQNRLAQVPPMQEAAREVLRNSIGMELKRLPAGTFDMGSDDGDAVEKPVHKVRLTKPFYLGIHEVTNGQWRAVMGGVVPSRWRDDDRPVENVSWDNAMEFCRKLSETPAEKAAGRVYRLPTEAEWEYACRAGTKTRFCFGDDEAGLRDCGWFRDNAGGQTRPVGRTVSNPWGLHDMHGNVWEWCLDWFGPYPNADGPHVDPLGPASGQSKVLRGGSWVDAGSVCRSALRNPNGLASRLGNVGLRVALDVPGSVITKPAVPAADPDPGTLASYRGAPGTTLAFNVVGALEGGGLWGDNPYTADSRLARAAVHAGVLRPGQGGVVRVTIMPGQPSYTGSTRHGVTSQRWGQYPLSYRIEPGFDPQPAAAADPLVGQWRWFINGNEIGRQTFLPGGQVQNAPDASWTLLDRTVRRYRITWQGRRFIDVMTLSADGRSLQGQNQEGATIAGTRVD